MTILNEVLLTLTIYLQVKILARSNLLQSARTVLARNLDGSQQPLQLSTMIVHGFSTTMNGLENTALKQLPYPVD